MNICVFILTIYLTPHIIQSALLRQSNPQLILNPIEESSNLYYRNNPSLIKQTKPYSVIDNSQCDLLTEGPICLFNGDRVLLPYATLEGLIGYWNFDEVKPLDNSGNYNHAIGNIKSGISFGGLGSSALFSSGEYLEIPSSPSFTSQNDFSITFFIFFIQDFFSASKGTRFCPLVHRGIDDISSNSYKRQPAIMYDRKEKNLQIYINTKNSTEIEGESFITKSKLTTQRWYHIALVKSGLNIKLYINGIIDSDINLNGEMDRAELPLYIGNTPWSRAECDYPFLIDEMRYYNYGIEEDMIQAETSPILGGIEPGYIKIGCLNCELEPASSACDKGYRLCTSIELHTGGYQIARSLGLIDYNTHIWTHGALKTPNDFENLKGLALCCAELY